MTVYDYIIVGAGSAGCVLANRLSQDRANRVLLLEAGGSARSLLVRTPVGAGVLASMSSRCWTFPTEPDQGNGGEARAFIRGRMLGGSSSLNGMVYCRGQPSDYDRWRDQGCAEWGWCEMSAAFRAIENHALGDDGVRGVGGPLNVSIRNWRTPLTEAILAAAGNLGTPRKEDVNRSDLEGIGYCPVTMHKGVRVSAADAFLKPARRRRNLTVVTGFLAHRLIWEGLRAVGVEGTEGSGKGIRQFRARGEVILATGALATPKLLMLSGIGPATHLRGMGITPRVDAPEVGENLLEHKMTVQRLRLTDPALSVNRELRGWRLARNALRFAAFRTGPLTATYDLTAFIRTCPELTAPDAQILLWALTYDRGADGQPRPAPEPGLLAMGYPLRTESRGRIRLRSADPAAPPQIWTNFLSSEHDRKVTIGTFRYLRRLFADPALTPYVESELVPGHAVQDDEGILAAARQAQTCQHTVGTCRMGADDGSVLDPRLRVRGVEGLRVVDLSAFPTQVSGNTNGPVMAFAWRAADLMLEDGRRFSSE